MKLEFDWNDAKAEANWNTYGVRFELATTAFKDPLLSSVLTTVKTMARTGLS